MCDIQALVEAYLITERDLVAAVDAAGGAVPRRPHSHGGPCRVQRSARRAPLAGLGDDPQECTDAGAALRATQRETPAAPKLETRKNEPRDDKSRLTTK